MSKTMQVLKMVSPRNGIITVVWHKDADCNPYWIYFESKGHKHLMEKYADMTSCLYWIYEATKPIG